MKIFGEASIRPAGQLKAGLDYTVNENVNMHIGYRGFGALGSNFNFNAEAKGEEVEVTKSDGEKEKQISQFDESNKAIEEYKSDSINIGNTLFTTHGIEAGLTFHFASKA